MSSMLQLEQYKRRFTLFRQGQLESPVVYPIARMQLPRFSILHHISIDGVEMGPDPSEPILRAVPGMIYIDHQGQYHSPIGNPIRNEGMNSAVMVNEYRRKNRWSRPLQKLERLETDDRALVVFNYSMLSHLVRYPTSFRADYYRWYNVYQELVMNVNRLAEDSRRQQYIEIRLPEVIPSLTVLREFRNNQTSQVMKQLRGEAEFNLAALFTWAGKERHKSLFAQIDPAVYDKVNLVFRRLNSWVVVNLAWLNSFRKDTEGPASGRGMDPVMFELKFLKLINTLHQAASPIETPTSDLVEKEPSVTEDTVEEDDSLDGVTDQLDEDDVPESDELLDDFSVIEQLENELAELDKIKEAASGYERTDEDGNIVDEKTVDIDAIGVLGETPKEGEALRKKADELAEQGLLTGGEYRRLQRISETFEKIPDPYGSGKTLVEAMKIEIPDLLLDPKPVSNDDVVVDKSLALSRVDQMERQYIDKVMRKDIMQCISSIQRAPVAITDYKIERVKDAANDQEIHVIRLAPAVGAPSTVRIAVPVVKPDGTFLYSNTHYRQRKQRADLPIRKISPTRVALSSYYGKVFAERTQRSRFNYGRWLMTTLVEKCLDPDNGSIFDAVLSSAEDYKAVVPWHYSTIAARLESFRIGQLKFWFDYKRRIKAFNYTDAELALEKDRWVLCGRGPRGPLLMDPAGAIYTHTANGMEDQGTIESLAMIDNANAPTAMVEVKIYSKTIPIGVVLAYLLGLDGLLKILKVRPRRVLPGERINLAAHEYMIRFKNETLVFDRNNAIATLIMSGFNLYHAHIRNYDVGLFNEKDVYAAVLERSGVAGRYLREVDMMNTLFIDPITRDLLETMSEPTSFTGLLVRSVEMLVHENVETRRKDRKHLVEGLERVRGYERIPGMVYETLSKAVRTYAARSGSGKASILINPMEVMTAVVQDPTTAPVNNINPIHSLREREVMTFGGRGGRSRRAMVASARLFTDEDMGFVSEGTVDSGDVAIITYLSPNANITSVRGTIRVYDPKRDGASSLMSSPALLAPAADGDDPKRINFINTQAGHGIPGRGYETQGIRTGMERSLVGRMGPEFASVAKGPGRVIEKTDQHVAVEYKDGSIDRFPIGLLHTAAEGSYYPNQLVTELEEGDKVSEFDVITYNTGFFKPSPFDKRRVDYMVGCVGRIALREATYTVEDSSSISTSFAERMVTDVSKLKSVRVDFGQQVSGLVKIGDTVDLETILCTIEDAVSADAGLYDEQTRETLRRWSAMTPRAKVVGTVAKIEVFYNGDPDDMSESLQEITAASEKERRRAAKRLGYEYTSGKIGRNVRIDGHSLETDQAVIQVYITTPIAMGIGDKLVVANQMKSTVGEILFGDNRTLEGESIDAIFGAKSCVDRIVTSPFIIGTTNTLLRYIGEEAYQAYFE